MEVEEELRVKTCDYCGSLMKKTDDSMVLRCPLCGWTHARSKVTEFFNRKRKDWLMKD